MRLLQNSALPWNEKFFCATGGPDGLDSLSAHEPGEFCGLEYLAPEKLLKSRHSIGVLQDSHELPALPAGVTTAGVATAGVTTAGVTTAGVTTAGVTTAGVTTAGVSTAR